MAAATRALLGASTLVPGGALAQSSPPAYPVPLSSLPDAETSGFHHWAIVPSLVVPTAALQAAINAQAGGPGFVALSEAGPGLSTIVVGSQIERFEQLSSGETSGPLSTLLLFTNALNVELGRIENLMLKQCSSSPVSVNQLYGSNVSIPGEFEAAIEQEEETQVTRFKIRCSDGFKVTLRARTSRMPGLRLKLDPAPVPNRYLSDGPHGSHPSYALAAEFDLIPIEPGMFQGFEAGDQLRLPGGKVPIVEVMPGFVLRNWSDRYDLE